LQDLYLSTPLASSLIPQSDLTDSTYAFTSQRDGSSTNILLQPPTTEEIAGYFSSIVSLKYSQPHQPSPSPFSPSLNGLTITAYSAGHTLGGTIWHIQHGLESVVYAVDWNQARELHLSGAAWLGGTTTGGAEVIEQLRRPTAMVCSSRGSEPVATAGARQKRDELLLDMIRETVRQGGSVLIPSDSSARVLELAYLLENSWMTENKNNASLRNAKLYLASRTCGATMRHARSMLEWMEEGIVRDFEAASSAPEQDHRRTRSQQAANQSSNRSDGNDDGQSPRAPFEFKHLRLLERQTQVNRALADPSPSVILASDSSMDWGFSKEVIQRIASDPRNLVILTEHTGRVTDGRSSLGRYLWDLWQQASASDQHLGTTSIIDASGYQFNMEIPQILPLDAAELPLYQQYLARQRQIQNVVQTEAGTAMETTGDVIDDRSSSSSSSDDESDDEQLGRALNVSAALSGSRHKVALSDAELGVNILIRRKGVHDFDVRGKRGREKMFPFVAKRRRVDDFGDLIRPEEFLRAEEREDVAGDEARNGSIRKETALGEKRKWGDVQTQMGAEGRKLANGTNKRAKAVGEDGTAGSRHGINGRDPDGDGQDEDDSASENEVDDQVTKVDGPSKLLTTTQTLVLNCRVSFVDFSGLHDKRSLHMIIPLIRPRKLILVAGEPDETKTLAEDCRKLLSVGASGSGEGTAEVFTPIIGDMIDASVDTNAWAVKLSQTLARKLQWQTVKGLGVVAITGSLMQASLEDSPELEGSNKRLRKDPEGASGSISKSDQIGEGTASLPILDLIPSSIASATRVAQPLHVGDMKLTELRRVLQASGLTTEFRGEGTLLVNGSVIVRKSGTGRIEVEGGGFSMGDSRRIEGTFYAVKKKIYESLAVVAGG
jgi:cleavage and polyadenylation specificity factor subunit 2